MTPDALRQRLARPAILMEIGGFRPPDSPAASWFGRVNLALPGETWPMQSGRAMHALCQINLTELPFRPPRLDDLEFLTVFIGPDELPVDAPNGEHWCLRAYRNLRELVALPQVDSGSWIKPFAMRPKAIDADFPCREDLPVELPPLLNETYHDHFENIEGFKLGGWPTLIQSEIFWAPENAHPAAPEYVFQIGTTQKGNWLWGDNGTGHFGRGTSPDHKDEWALEWQSF